MSKRNSQAQQGGRPRAAARRTRAPGQEGEGPPAGDRRRLGRRRPGRGRRHRLRRDADERAQRLGRGQGPELVKPRRRTPRATRAPPRHRQAGGEEDPGRSTRTYAARSAPHFEQASGRLHKDVDDGKYKSSASARPYRQRRPATGSKNALSALGAALNVSPEAFLDYKAALYSAKYHPQESDDKFAKDSYLLKVADPVPALKGNSAFKKAVEDGTYDKWAMKMSDRLRQERACTGHPDAEDGRQEAHRRRPARRLETRRTSTPRSPRPSRADSGRRPSGPDPAANSPTVGRTRCAPLPVRGYLCVIPVSILIDRDQSHPSSSAAPRSGSPPPHGRQGRCRHRGRCSPLARRRRPAPHAADGSRLPARRRLRRPAARRRPAVDPRHPHRPTPCPAPARAPTPR